MKQIWKIKINCGKIVPSVQVNWSVLDEKPLICICNNMLLLLVLWQLHLNLDLYLDLRGNCCHNVVILGGVGLRYLIDSVLVVCGIHWLCTHGLCICVKCGCTVVSCHISNLANTFAYRVDKYKDKILLQKFF